ncbi:MAG: UbiA family prenyltransferase [Candidatus Hodarchaeales archaeon]|jgi:1,4-dihydroxy-2-naphthoate octaprenyltransferase
MNDQPVKRHSIGTYIAATRPQFFTATLVPLLLGTAIAFSEGYFRIEVLFLVLMTGIFVHAGTNLINDYYDYLDGKGTDVIKLGFPEDANKFSGGSPFLKFGILSPTFIRNFAFSMYFLTFVSAVILTLIIGEGGWFLLLLAVVAILSGWLYSQPPFSLHSRWIGELLIGLNFGPVGVLGAYYVQNPVINFDNFLAPLIASVPVGMLIITVIWINEVPDARADEKAGKITMVVRMGKKKAVSLLPIQFLIAYAWIVIFVILGVLPYTALIALITFPLLPKIGVISMHNYNEGQKLEPANAMTVMVHLVTGLMLITGYIIAAVLSANGLQPFIFALN